MMKTLKTLVQRKKRHYKVPFVVATSIRTKPRIISLIIFIKMTKKFVFYMFLPNGRNTRGNFCLLLFLFRISSTLGSKLLTELAITRESSMALNIRVLVSFSVSFSVSSIFFHLYREKKRKSY